MFQFRGSLSQALNRPSRLWNLAALDYLLYVDKPITIAPHKNNIQIEIDKLNAVMCEQVFENL